MKTNITLSVLVFSAAFATPTLANYFHNPPLNLNVNIGSAPSPTPRDIRENRLPQVVHPAPPIAAAIDTRPPLSPSRRAEVRPDDAHGRPPA